MNIVLYVMAGLFTLSGIVTIACIGREREPLTPGLAAFLVAIDAAEIVALVLAAQRLS